MTCRGGGENDSVREGGGKPRPCLAAQLDEFTPEQPGKVDQMRPTLSVQQSMNLAWRHYWAGSREDAGMISLRVLQIQPRNPDALHLLGVLAYEVNDQDRAVELISQATRAHKRYAPMHGNLALAKLAQGDLAGAAASARRAFTLSPSYADAHRVLGLVFQRKGKLKDAIEEFQRAQRLGLKSADLQAHLAKAQDELAALTAKAAGDNPESEDHR